jgi:hypothetical protein
LLEKARNLAEGLPRDGRISALLEQLEKQRELMGMLDPFLVALGRNPFRSFFESMIIDGYTADSRMRLI